MHTRPPVNWRSSKNTMFSNMPLITIVATIFFAVGSLLLLAISPLAAKAQNLSLLPGDAVIAPAAGDQTAPAIAQGGNLRLAVWTDNRPNPSPFGIIAGSEYETSRDIYGVRIDADGNVLDAVPLRDRGRPCESGLSTG